ncbi:MAG: hypothetical protein ACKON9_20800 [Planctomycetaceae bacterium]
MLRYHVEGMPVALGLTELSLLLVFLKSGSSGKMLIDPMNLYADALVQDYFGLPPEQRGSA